MGTVVQGLELSRFLNLWEFIASEDSCLRTVRWVRLWGE